VIAYCTSSTIAEAWAYVGGLPAVVDATDAAVLLRGARERFPALREIPAIVAAPGGSSPVAAYWRHQVTWGNGDYVVRFGHRYLSVHFVRRENRYDRFDTTMRPVVADWLAAYASAFGAHAASHPVDVMSFGYANTFALEPEGFDVADYFGLHVGFAIGVVDAAALGLHTSVTVQDHARDVRLAVELDVGGANPSDPKLHVTTRVSAECDAADGTTFADAMTLEAAIVRAKAAARETFFNFTTPKTHAIMGAVHAAAAAG
jgi:hypothetical protein